MKKLLVIGYVWPEPNSSAAGYHILSIMRLFVGQQWQVTFATPAQQTDFNHDLSREGIDSHQIALNDASFDQYVSETQPTAVLYDRFMMEEQFGWRVSESAPNALQILDTEDLQCLRDARHQALKAKKAFSLESLVSDLCKREIASIFRCDLSLIISDFEMSLLQDHFKVSAELLVHVPFMLETGSLSVNPASFEQRQHFVTIGNLRHAPNWDSILYLQQIWPKIRQALPAVELHIYGAYTPPIATALNNPKIGFLIKDRADDVNLVMQQARVCLSPLRFGAGIKGKFIDAMRNQTPIITTDIGAEGMTAGLEWPGLVANSEEPLIESAINLYQTQSLWETKKDQCHSLLKANYDGREIGLRLITQVESILANLETHRRKNFIGSMLNFHSLRSTKYMSKWIEEKNKQSKRSSSNDA